MHAALLVPSCTLFCESPVLPPECEACRKSPEPTNLLMHGICTLVALLHTSGSSFSMHHNCSKGLGNCSSRTTLSSVAAAILLPLPFLCMLLHHTPVTSDFASASATHHEHSCSTPKSEPASIATVHQLASTIYTACSSQVTQLPCRSQCQAGRHHWPRMHELAAQGQDGTLCDLEARLWRSGGRIRRQWRAPLLTGPAGWPRSPPGTLRRTFACAQTRTEPVNAENCPHITRQCRCHQAAASLIGCATNDVFESAGNRELHKTCTCQADEQAEHKARGITKEESRTSAERCGIMV